jgi:hypothetical protein
MGTAEASELKAIPKLSATPDESGGLGPGGRKRRGSGRGVPTEEKVHDLAREFCRDLSLCPRGQSFRRDDTDYVVFCFGDAVDAALFRKRFNGEPFDPKKRNL